MTDNPEAVEVTLEPCPFCGRKAVWATKGNRDFRGPWLAHCGEQDCPGHQYEQDEQGGYLSAHFSKAEAIAAWNRRLASSTPPAEPVAWMWTDQAGTVHCHPRRPVVLFSGDSEPVPLYAAPTPAAVDDGLEAAARAYIRDWCPDHVRDYVYQLEALTARADGGE